LYENDILIFDFDRNCAPGAIGTPFALYRCGNSDDEIMLNGFAGLFDPVGRVHSGFGDKLQIRRTPRESSAALRYFGTDCRPTVSVDVDGPETKKK
jgi:hypothetical protein